MQCARLRGLGNDTDPQCPLSRPAAGSRSDYSRPVALLCEFLCDRSFHRSATGGLFYSGELSQILAERWHRVFPL
jgi:hypothetical protein